MGFGEMEVHSLIHLLVAVQSEEPQELVWHFGSWSLTAGVRACLGELQLRKNSSRAADPRGSTVEQLHRGSEI
jgi:hypothetical protein